MPDPNDEALKALLSSHREFRRFLRKRLSSEAEAEDLLQQSLLKAVERRGSLREGTSVMAWFYRILRNALIDHYRTHASESAKYAEYLNELKAVQGNAEQPEGVLKKELCACFLRLLPALKPEYAEILRRADLQEETLEKIAVDLGITMNNLLVRLHRARRALRANLILSCGTCTKHGCLDCHCGE